MTSIKIELCAILLSFITVAVVELMQCIIYAIIIQVQIIDH